MSGSGRPAIDALNHEGAKEAEKEETHFLFFLIPSSRPSRLRAFVVQIPARLWAVWKRVMAARSMVTPRPGPVGTVTAPAA